MIEVKNLHKTYKTKKGIEVKALDDVSLVLPNTGMVFILGKSGSGKSTFLNVLGGLDKYDSGEIIIKGKSSKDFSQSDFDSYRNTYLGFIFQEYNILDEFSVGANIALAIELQGRKATSDEVNKILTDVDLVGYHNRKPNELSGGQLQRVAIARALIKNPEIIMADEPTGALDSNTGKAVFDTLKHLSKEKLVIIVSHDRDFAENYADRIIEFMDGKVISDVEQEVVTTEEAKKGLQIIDNKIIQIKKGYVLTQEDINLITDYINKSNAGTIISMDEDTNTTIRRDAKISEEGSQTKFVNTDSSKYDASQDSGFKLIKSKLSIRNAFKIGASSLKVKKFRLAFTILLSFVSFGLFGLANTLGSFSKEDGSVSSYVDSKVEYLVFSKGHYDEWASDGIKLNDEDIKLLSEKTGIEYQTVYAYNDTISSSVISYDSLSQSYYYGCSSFKGLYEIDNNASFTNDLGFKFEGKLPTNDNEIAITKHMAEAFVVAGYRDETTTPSDDFVSNIKKDSEILNKTININGKTYKVTGLIDTNFEEERYASLKKNDDEGGIDTYLLSGEYQEVIQYGFHNVLFVAKGSAQVHIPALKTNGISLNGCYFGNDNGGFSVESGVDYSECEEAKFFDASKTTLAMNEILISRRQFSEIYGKQIGDINDKFADNPSEQLWQKKENALRTYAYANFTTDVKDGSLSSADDYTIYLGNEGMLVSKYGKSGNEITKTIEYNFYKDNGLFNTITKKYKTYLPDPSGFGQKEVEFTVVGYYEDALEYTVFMNAEMINSLKSNSGLYAFAIAKMPTDKSKLEKVVEYNYANQEEVMKSVGDYYSIKNAPQYMLDQVNGIIEILAKVFFWVGFGFAVFASLLLFNFICFSINYKRREIGILRAVGARGKDVFSIFFSESFIIAMINFVLAAGACQAVVIILNNTLRNEYGLLITILNMHALQYGLILAVSMGVAFISSFIPVFRISRQRPIDAIREK